MENLVSSPDAAFWHGKRVLLTGLTGFKGSWLAIWLHRLGAEVIGLSLPPVTEPDLFSLARLDQACESHVVDIRDTTGVTALVRSCKPQIVFHLAAQSLVREGYRNPLETYQTNVMGTAHLLDALRGLDSVKVAVMVTTDKVYRNAEKAHQFREDEPLGGHDPYSASKAASEMIIGSYNEAYLAEQGVAVGVARAGNVIGGGDWSADRLIPDAIRAWQSGRTLSIRRPNAIRPWQHVLDPLSGYLVLAQQLWCDPARSGSYNFGPEADAAVSVQNVIELARQGFNSAQVEYTKKEEGPREAGLLMLSIEKARAELGVKPRWILREAVENTIAWYRAQDAGADALELCLSDIDRYESGS